MTKKLYFSVAEMAKHFGINPTTVYRLAQKGRLPGFKVGNQWRFSEAMLASWVAGKVMDSGVEKPPRSGRGKKA